MARIRTIKPSFWAHEELSALPEATHILAGALLNYADDHGYFNANIGLIRAACTPLREPSVPIPESLRSLQAMGYLRFGTAPDGKRYGHVVHFADHQKVSHPTDSKIAALSIVWDVSGNPPEPIAKAPDPLRPEGNKEGNKEKDSASLTAAPSGPLDLAKQVWDTGVAFLVSRSVDPKQARSFLGKLRKSNDDAAILAALARAEAATAVDPIPFLTATLKGKPDGKRREDRDTQRRRRRSEILEGLGAAAPVERGEHPALGGESDPDGDQGGAAEHFAGGPEGAGNRGGAARGVGGSVQHAGSGLESRNRVLSRELGPSPERPADRGIPGGTRNPQMGNAPAPAERVAGGGERPAGRTEAVDREAGDCETLSGGERQPAAAERGRETAGGRTPEPVAHRPVYDRDADLEIPPQFRRTA